MSNSSTTVCLDYSEVLVIRHRVYTLQRCVGMWVAWMEFLEAPFGTCFLTTSAVQRLRVPTYPGLPMAAQTSGRAQEHWPYYPGAWWAYPTQNDHAAIPPWHSNNVTTLVVEPSPCRLLLSGSAYCDATLVPPVQATYFISFILCVSCLQCIRIVWSAVKTSWTLYSRHKIICWLFAVLC